MSASGTPNVDIARLPLLDAPHSAEAAAPQPQQQRRRAQPQDSARCSDARSQLVELSTLGRASRLSDEERAAACPCTDKGTEFDALSSSSSFVAVTCSSPPGSALVSSPLCMPLTFGTQQCTQGRSPPACSPHQHGAGDVRVAPGGLHHGQQIAECQPSPHADSPGSRGGGWRCCAPLLLRTSSASQVRGAATSTYCAVPVWLPRSCRLAIMTPCRPAHRDHGLQQAEWLARGSSCEQQQGSHDCRTARGLCALAWSPRPSLPTSAPSSRGCPSASSSSSCPLASSTRSPASP